MLVTLRAAVIVGGLAAATAANACDVTCPLDNRCMVFTGNTDTEWGKLVWQYRCPGGHVNWVAKGANRPASQRSCDVECQYDNMCMTFTGETRSDWGKLLRKYRCPGGHAAWVVP